MSEASSSAQPRGTKRRQSAPPSENAEAKKRACVYVPLAQHPALDKPQACVLCKQEYTIEKLVQPMRCFASSCVQHEYRVCRAHFCDELRKDLKTIGKHLSTLVAASSSTKSDKKKDRTCRQLQALVTKWATQCTTRCEQFHLLKAMVETLPLVRVHTSVKFAAQYLFEDGQAPFGVDERYLILATICAPDSPDAKSEICDNCNGKHSTRSGTITRGKVSTKVIRTVETYLVDAVLNSTVNSHPFHVISFG